MFGFPPVGASGGGSVRSSSSLVGCLGLWRKRSGLSLWFARIQLLEQLAWELPGPPNVLLGLGSLISPGRPPGELCTGGPPFVVERMPFVSGVG